MSFVVEPYPVFLAFEVTDIETAERVLPTNYSLYPSAMLNGVITELDQRLWVEGNLSVDYGGELQQCTKPFSLVFDPKEMAQALKIPLNDISLCTNSFAERALDPMPFEVACFPYAQHFVTTSVLTATTMRTGEDLEKAVNEINNKMKAPEEIECKKKKSS